MNLVELGWNHSWSVHFKKYSARNISPGRVMRQDRGHYLVAMENGDVDALVVHVEAEQGMVAEIFAVQKVIDPLEDMYRAAYHGAAPEGIDDLKASLGELQTEVVKRNGQNQVLLKQRVEMLRHEIMTINNPYSKRKSVYSGNPEPRALDIKG